MESPLTWNEKIKQERVKRHWTQQELAGKLGVDQITLTRWESGSQLPSAHRRVKLAELFELKGDDLANFVEEVPLSTPDALFAAKQEEAIVKVAEADPADIQAIAAATQALISSYYQSGLYQSQRSFRWSLIWGGIGLAFLIIVILVLLLGQPTQIAVASGICAVIVEAFASIFLYLYKHASDQLAAFRVGLEDTQRLLLANSMCEKLKGEQEQTSRAEIIRLVVTSATTLKKQERFFLPPEQKQ